MRSRACVLICLLAIAVTAAFPSLAQGPLLGIEAEGLAEIGGWLFSTLTSYGITKAVDPYVDKILGRDNEKKLQEMESRLKRRLDDKNAADRKQVEDELKVARKELEILRSLMEGRPTKTQVTKYRAELDSDLKLIRETLAEHERRLAEHDQKLAEQGKIIEDQGRELDGLKTRMDQLQPPMPPIREPVPPRNYGPAGATLTIQVRGKDNLIRLREATHPVMMGTFSFSRNGANAAYFLPRQARAIVELFGPNNRISMPAQIAQQVQILSHGFYYQKLVY